jgi:hypothetical protein
MTAQQVVRRKGVFGLSSWNLPFLSVNKTGRSVGVGGLLGDLDV